MKKKETIVVDTTPKTIWWYFADDNYLGLKIAVISVLFMAGLWYFGRCLSVV